MDVIVFIAGFVIGAVVGSIGLHYFERRACAQKPLPKSGGGPGEESGNP